jgi:two-component system cell cycle response regulator
MSARVLVVDDVLANVKLMEARLTAEYFDVVTAMNGPEALALCERTQCDIVLLDVMMPEMDGFEVCRRLKANPKTHPTVCAGLKPGPTISSPSRCPTSR